MISDKRIINFMMGRVFRRYLFLTRFRAGVAETLNVRKFLDNQQQIAVGQHAQTVSPPTSTVIAQQTNTVISQRSEAEEQRHIADWKGARRLFRTLKYAFDREALIVAAIAVRQNSNLWMIVNGLWAWEVNCFEHWLRRREYLSYIWLKLKLSLSQI